MSRPRTLSVNGGVAWTPGCCVMIGGSVERLHLLLIDSDFVEAWPNISVCRPVSIVFNASILGYFHGKNT